MFLTAPTPFIKWAVLGQILWVSLVSGIGIAGLVSLGVFTLSKGRQPGVTNSARLSQFAVTAVCVVLTLAAVAWGLYLITHKSH